ncbi:hypothetical protein CM49_02518 [Paenibacillus sp. P1XP2]|nr:hypothetical protein CM49_02518 [Paenibacillus sp. P1XP2]
MAEPVFSRREKTFGDVNFAFRAKREHPVFVFEHDDRFKLCFVTFPHKFGVPDQLGAFLWIEVRIFKQAEAEHIFQQPDGRLLEAFPHIGFAVFSNPDLVSSNTGSISLLPPNWSTPAISSL